MSMKHAHVLASHRYPFYVPIIPYFRV
uniref:Uncharacterized protein n=1 Tax=Arundo donax TaxID=35708 RepID=A0A0A9BA81_ARUDO